MSYFKMTSVLSGTKITLKQLSLIVQEDPFYSKITFGNENMTKI